MEFAISEVRTCTCAAERPASRPQIGGSDVCAGEACRQHHARSSSRRIDFRFVRRDAGPSGRRSCAAVEQFLPGFTGTIAEAAEMYRASYTAVKYKSYGLEDGAIALHVEPLTDH